MSAIQIPNLSAAIALNGAEQLEAVQAGTSVRVTTQQIANLSVGPEFGTHGSFYSTVTQTNPVASAVNKMTFNTTSSNDGVIVVSNSRLTVPFDGVYNIQFSAQVQKTDGGTDSMDIWIQKSGNNVDYSNTRVELAGNGAKQVAAWNWMIELAANEYVEICWSSADTDVNLHAELPQVTPTRPGIPSVIATVAMVVPI
ncbi:MAG: hypothetical protein ABFD60_15285 [Bryobacteraceae bacterium]